MKASILSLKRQLKLTSRKRIFRLKEAISKGFHSESIRRLEKSGKIIHVSRGVYSLPEADFSEHYSLAIVAKRVPTAVICLLSALNFHELTTQLPHEVWIAIDNKAKYPSLDYPLVRVHKYSKKGLSQGIGVHMINGIPVKIFNPAKTIADCFKFRNKIGLDVAMEALNDGLKQKKATYREILFYARICRVEKIIQPYLETIAWQQSEQ